MNCVARRSRFGVSFIVHSTWLTHVRKKSKLPKPSHWHQVLRVLLAVTSNNVEALDWYRRLHPFLIIMTALLTCSNWKIKVQWQRQWAWWTQSRNLHCLADFHCCVIAWIDPLTLPSLLQNPSLFIRLFITLTRIIHARCKQFDRPWEHQLVKYQ